MKKWNALRPKLKHLSVAVKKIERQFLRSNEMKRFVETTPRTIRYDGNSNSEDMVAVMLVKKQKIDTKKFSSSAHSSGVLVSSILVLTKNIRRGLPANN